MSNRGGKPGRRPGRDVVARSHPATPLPGQVTVGRGIRADDSGVEVHESFYAGPLPPAAELERYAAVDPDAVRIILGSFNEEGRHRRALEMAVVAGGEQRSDRGQLLASALVALGVLGGVVIALAGRAPVAGAGLSGAAIGSAALIYLVGGRSPHPDDDRAAT